MRKSVLVFFISVGGIVALIAMLVLKGDLSLVNVFKITSSAEETGVGQVFFYGAASLAMATFILFLVSVLEKREKEEASNNEDI